MLENYAKYEELKLDSPADRILRIRFDKPDTLNSVDKAGHRELTYIWRDLDEDQDFDVAILTGEG